MKIYELNNLIFAYPNTECNVLRNITLDINRGEFVTLCGKSGCGKTTLLRLLSLSLAPDGSKNGEIFFEGKPTDDVGQREAASKIGFVMQNPDDQIVTDKVWHELAFGLESLGYPTNEIRKRVSEMSSFFGIQTWFRKNTYELSGGQKQILNLASAMVMNPDVLILDEPTSQLDPIAARDFLNILERINRELGVTVIISEHNLEDVFAISDRVVVMDSGEIIADDEPKKISGILKKLNHHMAIALPTPVRVYGEMDGGDDCPLTIRDGKQWLDEYSKTHTPNENKAYERLGEDVHDSDNKKFDTVIEVKDVWFRYGKDMPDVIKDLNIKIRKGEFMAIVGGNGTGKTTMLSLIAGINRHHRGKILIDGCDVSDVKCLSKKTVGLLPQNPQCVFSKNDVYSELEDMLSDAKIGNDEKHNAIIKTAKLCEIDKFTESHPYDLSGGEQQRVALAKILLMSPEILLLDEPTKGFDAHFKRIFARIISKLKAKGVTIVAVSHDIEFCAEFADRCAMFFDGGVTAVASTRDFFAGNNFYTTAANRMARNILPKAVITDDITSAFGLCKEPDDDFTDESSTYTEKCDESRKEEVYESFGTENSSAKKLRKGKISPRNIIALIMIAVMVPLTAWCGMYYFDDKKYYAISMLIIAEILIPFCMMYEGKKPKAREIAVVSMMSAIAVASRCVFYTLPQVKPILALIIISGVCLGCERGCLIGVVSAFVSNFFFGQGPWTPWQMFAMGLIGFIGGIVFKKLSYKRKLPLCIFGFLTVIVIYGGIMNVSTVIMYQDEPTFDMLVAACTAGFPFDLLHAISTAAFLWFLAKPMGEKLERVKIKYGIL